MECAKCGLELIDKENAVIYWECYPGTRTIYKFTLLDFGCYARGDHWATLMKALTEFHEDWKFTKESKIQFDTILKWYNSKGTLND